MPRTRGPYLIGLGVLVAAFIVAWVLTGSVLLALLIGLLLGSASAFGSIAALATGRVKSVSPDVIRYRADARRRTHELHEKLAKARAIAEQIRVRKRAAYDSVTTGCDQFEQIIREVQRVDEGSVAKTAAQLNNYLYDVLIILSQYTEILDHPRRYGSPPDEARMLLMGEEGFKQFVEFGHERVDELTQGNIKQYQRALENVRPPLSLF